MKNPFASLSFGVVAKLKRNRRERNLIAPSSFRGARSANPESRDSPMCNCTSEVQLFELSRNDDALLFKLFVTDDLDAKTGQSLVVVHRRGQMADRGDAEIAQDLRADADLAPLPVAVGFRGFLLRQRRHGDTGGAIAQIYQHAATGFLEMLEHGLHAFRAGKDVLDDIGFVEARQHVP